MILVLEHTQPLIDLLLDQQLLLMMSQVFLSLVDIGLLLIQGTLHILASLVVHILIKLVMDSSKIPNILVDQPWNISILHLLSLILSHHLLLNVWCEIEYLFILLWLVKWHTLWIEVWMSLRMRKIQISLILLVRPCIHHIPYIVLLARVEMSLALRSLLVNGLLHLLVIVYLILEMSLMILLNRIDVFAHFIISNQVWLHHVSHIHVVLEILKLLAMNNILNLLHHQVWLDLVR
jgi:hypothetical protein